VRLLPNRHTDTLIDGTAFFRAREGKKSELDECNTNAGLVRRVEQFLAPLGELPPIEMCADLSGQFWRTAYLTSHITLHFFVSLAKCKVHQLGSL